MAYNMTTRRRSKHVASWRGTCSKCGCSVSGGGAGIRPPRDGEQATCITCLDECAKPRVEEQEKWIDLSTHWETLQRIAETRQGKRRSARQDNWKEDLDSHLIGLCGEMTIELLCGLSFDRTLLPGGDRGYDFIAEGVKCETKASTYLSDPHLKVRPGKVHLADIFCLIGLDMHRKCARVIGWATSQQVQQARLRRYGHAQVRSLTQSDLAILNQTGLPPVLARLDEQHDLLDTAPKSVVE